MDNRKAPFVSVDYEEYHEDKIYSFTINPSDTYQKFGRTDRINRFIEDIEKKLNSVLGLEYMLYIEISKFGRLHLHGYTRTRKNQKLNFYLYGIEKIKDIGCFCLKPIDDILIWDKYIRKQDLPQLLLNSDKLSDDVKQLIFDYTKILDKQDIEQVD